MGGQQVNPLPYAPDHSDPAVTARHADRRALISQIPGGPPMPSPANWDDQAGEDRAEAQADDWRYVSRRETDAWDDRYERRHYA
jgi:hypothetical protein